MHLFKRVSSSQESVVICTIKVKTTNKMYGVWGKAEKYSSESEESRVSWLCRKG